MSIRIFCDQTPLSINRVLRMHWAKRKLYNEAWLQEVFLAKNRLKIFGRPELRQVDLRFTLMLHGQKEMDADNAVASVKPIIDALVTVGILKDDDKDGVRSVSVDQIRVPRRQAGAVVEIEESLPRE